MAILAESCKSPDKAKQDQTIYVEPDPLPTRIALHSVFNMTVSASSGLRVAVTNLTPVTCEVTGMAVQSRALGECKVRLVQAGDSQWNAVQAELSFTISGEAFQIWLPLVMR